MIHDGDTFAMNQWRHGEVGFTGSVETLVSPLDKYGLSDFAADDFPKFLAMVDHLSPRDAEIMLCFAVLQMRPTDLSVLFGKAGHRAEEDLHKAAHKLAGLIQFGTEPAIAIIDGVLERHLLAGFGGHTLAACLWQYARSRDFAEVNRLIGQRGLRQQMLRAFKTLHAAEDREAGLLAGWILWLVDQSDPRGKGWQKRQRTGRERKLGPVVFHSSAITPKQLTPRATGRGGFGQRPDVVKINRKMKFLLRKP